MIKVFFSRLLRSFHFFFFMDHIKMIKKIVFEFKIYLNKNYLH